MNHKIFNLGLIIFIGLVFYSKPSFSQSDEEQLKELERYIETRDQSADYNDLQDFLILKPDAFLDINKATYLDFLGINGINAECVKAILNHRRLYGAFVSLLELQTIDAITFESLQLLKRYLTLDSKDLYFKTLWPILKKSDKEIMLKISTSRPLAIGYMPLGNDSVPKYLGSPNAYQLRFRAKVNQNIWYGFNAEKDEGEDFFSAKNRQGFDFYSAHFFIAKRGLIKKIAVGDFQANFGQGLTMSSGLGLGKSAYVLNVKQNNSGLRPFRSFNETQFLRGVGLTVDLKKFESTLFVSRHKIDATLNTIDRDGLLSDGISSLVNTGWHRTDLEKSKKNAVLKVLVGHNLSYKFKTLSLGLVNVYHAYDKPILQKTKLYSQYYFSGKSYLKSGLYFDYWLKNVNFFGETCLSSFNVNGYLVGGIMSLAGDLDLVMVHRNYSKTLNGDGLNSFSENSNSNNEVGTYFGFVFKWAKKRTFSCYVDRYASPWYAFNVDGQGRGTDFLAEYNLKPNKSTVLYVRFKHKLELENNEIGHFNELNFTEKYSFRMHAEAKINPVLSLKTRIEFSNYLIPKNTFSGNMIYVDFIYHPNSVNFSATTRLSFFNVDDYSARIYALENDVLYTYTVVGLSGSGAKIYGILKYKYKSLNLQMRYSFIRYYDRSTIGSSYGTVNSKHLHEINFLIGYAFD